MASDIYHLIFIDDDEDFLHSMQMAIASKLPREEHGVEIETHFLGDPNDALAFIQELVEEQEKIAIIISDQQMTELTGIQFMEKARTIVPKAFKILLTGYASLDSAKYAINHQILDRYVSKPIEDYDNFISLIRNSIETFHLRKEKELADQEIKHYVYELEMINTKIKSMHQAAEKIAYLAQGFRKLDLDEVLDLIINRIPPLFNAKYASLFLLKEEDNSLHMARSNYLKSCYTKSLDSDDLSPMMVAIKQNKIIVLPEIGQASYDFLQKECLGNSCVIIPFIIEGEHCFGDLVDSAEGLKGVFNLGNISDMESEEIVEYSATLIRNILGINILNAQLYQQTQRLALVDGLTGLYNKHIFMEFLHKECAYSEHHGTTFFLVIFDVDDFKAVNDTYGHRIGDKVLDQLGLLLTREVRQSDIIGRFGGEEFAWIIHGADAEHIMPVVERMRSEVCNSDFPNSIRLSLSIGVTRYDPQGNDSIQKLIDRAEQALYRAQGNGKNRIEVFFTHGHHC